MRWWREELALRRFVSDVIAGHLSVLRPTARPLPASPLHADLDLTRDLGIDSLELVGIASALNEVLHLHESGVEDHLLMCATIGEWVTTAAEGLDAFSDRLTFRTSGSSGAPKQCIHPLKALLEEVETLAAQCDGRHRVLTAVRSHHIYGFLFSVLLPQRLGLRGADVLDVRRMLPSSVVSCMRAGDLVIGYPDFWRDIARCGVAIAPGVIGVTSTAPCPDAVAHDVMTAGLDTLIQVYGSTETAGVGIRSRPDVPYTLFAHWQRSPHGEREIVRMAEDGERTRVALPDICEWSDDRHFVPIRRLDDVVQVAGVNVSLGRVRNVLLAHPGVADAVVRLMDGASPPRLKAFVVAREGADHAALHAQLEARAEERLTAPERPRAYTFGHALPVDALGKRADWTITATDAHLIALPP
jgi:long-chain acyl-CoA synthetase